MLAFVKTNGRYFLRHLRTTIRLALDDPHLQSLRHAIPSRLKEEAPTIKMDCEVSSQLYLGRSLDTSPAGAKDLAQYRSESLPPAPSRSSGLRSGPPHSFRRPLP